MYLKGVRYEIGRVHALATAPRILELVNAGRLDPGVIVTKTVPFTDAGMTDSSVKIVFVNDLDPIG